MRFAIRVSLRNALQYSDKGGHDCVSALSTAVACVSVCVCLIVVTSGATKRALHAGLGDADHVTTTIERACRFARVTRRRSPSLDDVGLVYGVYRYH